MILTRLGAVEHLARAHLLDSDVVTGGDVAVESAARRNCNLKVIAASGPAYFVKQGLGSDGRAAIAHEAATYALLHEHAGAARLGRYLVRCHAHDARAGVLVLELVRGAESMAEYHARRGRFPRALAARLGDALGALHHLTRAWTPHTAGLEPPPAPGVLSIHRPTSAVFHDTSAANIELIKLVQRTPALCAALDDLCRGWRVDALIHGDVKGDNVIVARPGGPRSATVLKLVDWETAHLGDACWDVGAVFAEYLGVWARSVPASGGEQTEQALRSARYPLARIQPAVRAYWHAYVRRMRLDPPTAAWWLLRAARYTGARLVQTAYERAQLASRLPYETRALLQLGLNIVQRPLEAAAHLLGVPLEPPPPAAPARGRVSAAA